MSTRKRFQKQKSFSKNLIKMLDKAPRIWYNKRGTIFFFFFFFYVSAFMKTFSCCFLKKILDKPEFRRNEKPDGIFEKIFLVKALSSWQKNFFCCCCFLLDKPPKMWYNPTESAGRTDRKNFRLCEKNTWQKAQSVI